MQHLTLVHYLLASARHQLTLLRHDERGEVTEKVIITAVFAMLALTAGAIIVAKVVEKANGIPTE